MRLCKYAFILSLLITKVVFAGGMGPQLYCIFKNGLVYEYLKGTPLNISNCREVKMMQLVASHFAEWHSRVKVSFSLTLFKVSALRSFMICLHFRFLPQALVVTLQHLYSSVVNGWSFYQTVKHFLLSLYSTFQWSWICMCLRKSLTLLNSWLLYKSLLSFVTTMPIFSTWFMTKIPILWDSLTMSTPVPISELSTLVSHNA